MANIMVTSSMGTTTNIEEEVRIIITIRIIHKCRDEVVIAEEERVVDIIVEIGIMSYLHEDKDHNQNVEIQDRKQKGFQKIMRIHRLITQMNLSRLIEKNL